MSVQRLYNKVIQNDIREGTLGADNVYINFSIVNNNSSGLPIPLVYEDNRSAPVIEDPCQYYLAVQKFHISTIGLPIYIPQIQLNNEDANVNLTNLSFTLQYGSDVFQSYLNYVPQNASAPVPSSVSSQDLSTDYYFIQSYSYLVNLMNDTLKACFEGLQGIEGIELPNGCTAPFILFDPSSNECVLNCDSNYEKSNTTPINLYCNHAMYNLLSGFEYTHYANNTDGMNHKLNVYNNFYTNQVELNNITYYQAYEQYSSCNTWNPVKSILITTNNLPIYPQIINDTVQFNTMRNNFGNNSNATMNVLSEFSVAVDEANSYLPAIDYSTGITNTYRLIDLFGHGNVSNIKMNVYWQDYYGNVYTLYLANGQAADLTLIFRRKSFFNN